jgi:hypothetical protein
MIRKPLNPATIERLRRIEPYAAWTVFALSLWYFFGDALLEHMRYAADPAVYNDDSRQQIYPFFRYEDRTLFHGDYIGDYYLACYPIGYFILYFIGAKAAGAVLVSKVVPYVLLAATIGALAACAHTFGRKTSAWFVAAVCLGTSLYLDRMAGGLPRGFGFPLVAGGALGLVLGKSRWLSALVWAGAAFYPASAPVIGIALALLLLVLPAKDRGEAAPWSLRRRSIHLAVTAGIAVLILLPSIWASHRYGPVITPAKVAQFPEAGRGGRYIVGDDCAPFKGMFETADEVLQMPFTGAGPPLVPSIKTWVEADRTHARFRNLLYLALLIAGAGWIRLILLRSEARRLSLLLVAAVVGHLLARTFPPLLYLPQRYLLYPLPSLAVVVMASGVLGFFPQRVLPRRLAWLKPLEVSLVAVLVLACFGAHGSNRAGLNVKVKKTGGYDFISKLSPDVLVAGWPGGFMDNVPYVSRRRPLVTAETYQAFHARYTLEMRRRTEAIIDAYFAADLAPLLRLKREFNVTHFVVELPIVQRRSAHVFKPIDQHIAEAVRRSRGSELEVERQFANAVYRDKSRVILDLSKLSTGQQAAASP